MSTIDSLKRLLNDDGLKDLFLTGNGVILVYEDGSEKALEFSVCDNKTVRGYMARDIDNIGQIKEDASFISKRVRGIEKSIEKSIESFRNVLFVWTLLFILMAVTPLLK